MPIQPTKRLNNKTTKQTDGNLSLISLRLPSVCICVLLPREGVACRLACSHHIVGTHTAFSPAQVWQKNPFGFFAIHFPAVSVCRDGVLMRRSRSNIVVHLETESHRVYILLRNRPLRVADMIVEHHSALRNAFRTMCRTRAIHHL